MRILPVASLVLYHLCVIVGWVRGARRGMGLANAPCPNPACQCLHMREELHIICAMVTESLPAFQAVNLTYSTLSLVQRNLTYVPSDAFRPLKVLAIDLSENLFHHGLSDKAFRGLEDVLEVLALSYCSLTEIPSRSLNGLERLHTLKLDGNRIRAIRKRDFEGVSALRELHIYRNRISRIEPDGFAGLTNLQHLKLSENRLVRLRKGTFKSLSNLRSLDCSYNRIRTLTSGALKGLGKLRWLEFNSNRLGRLSKKMFRGVRRMKYLKLDHNPLYAIANNTFTAIRRLNYLSIDIGNVTNISAGTFSGLSRLKTLNLGEISRRDLPADCFTYLKRVTYLSVLDSSLRFRGLSPDMFSRDMKYDQLSIWTVPIIGCKCSHPWIRRMTRRGAYVHGYCAKNQPVSCRRSKFRRPTKKPTVTKHQSRTIRATLMSEHLGEPGHGYPSPPV